MAGCPELRTASQAPVRATLKQQAHDAAAGIGAAGFVTGWHGQALGAVDQPCGTAAPLPEPACIGVSPSAVKGIVPGTSAGVPPPRLR